VDRYEIQSRKALDESHRLGANFLRLEVFGLRGTGKGDAVAVIVIGFRLDAQ
jgi:hypothetical protein